MMQKPITFWSGKLTAAPVPMIASPLKIEPDVALIRMRISYHNFRVGCVCYPMPRQLPVDGSGNA